MRRYSEAVKADVRRRMSPPMRHLRADSKCQPGFSRRPSSVSNPGMSWARVAPLGDRPEALEPEGIDCQAARRRQGLDAVAFAVAVSVLPELDVPGPVPGILDRPPVSHVLQQGCGCGPETRDVVTGFINGLAVAHPFAAHREDRATARPVLHHPVRCGMPRRFTSGLGQSVMDDLKPFAGLDKRYLNGLKASR